MANGGGLAFLLKIKSGMLKMSPLFKPLTMINRQPESWFDQKTMSLFTIRPRKRSKSKLGRCSVSEEIMISLEYKDGLLFTSLEIEFKGARKIVDNMVIDPGAAETILLRIRLKISACLLSPATMSIPSIVSVEGCITFSGNQLTVWSLERLT